MLESVDRHHQLHDSVRDRRARGLDHKHVRLTDVLIDLDEHVLVGETDESRAAEVGPQTFADGLGQFWMSGAADDLDSRDHVAPPVHVRPPRPLGREPGAEPLWKEPKADGGGSQWLRAIWSCFGRELQPFAHAPRVRPSRAVKDETNGSFPSTKGRKPRSRRRQEDLRPNTK